MTKLTAVKPMQTVMPSHYLEAMADTAMKLMCIDEGRDVGLIMGYPVHLTNLQAISYWIHDYLAEHPEQTNFKKYVFPALVAYLQQCEMELFKLA